MLAIPGFDWFSTFFSLSCILRRRKYVKVLLLYEEHIKRCFKLVANWC